MTPTDPRQLSTAPGESKNPLLQEPVVPGSSSTLTPLPSPATLPNPSATTVLEAPETEEAERLKQQRRIERLEELKELDPNIYPLY